MLLSGWHVTIFSRNANDGTNAGTFYWNLNNVSGYLDRSFGGRLAGSSKKKWSRKSSVHTHTQIGSPIVQNARGAPAYFN